MISFDFDDTLTLPVMEDGIWVSTTEPNETVVSLLRHLSNTHDIAIVSTRNDIGKDEILEFVEKHNIPVDIVKVTGGELKAATLNEIGSVLHFDDCVEDATKNRSEGILTIIVPHPFDLEQSEIPTDFITFHA